VDVSFFIQRYVQQRLALNRNYQHCTNILRDSFFFFCRTFKILYSRDTSAITKATSDLKSSVKERFKSSITVEYDEDSRRIHFLFPYNTDFMNLIKTHIQVCVIYIHPIYTLTLNNFIKGRTWNSICKRWEAPLTSAVGK
jgi:hypothetical protein